MEAARFSDTYEITIVTRRNNPQNH